MKFSLSTKIAPIGSTEGLPFKDLILMALSADPVFDNGPQAGQPRPLSAEEIMGRVWFLNRADADEIEVTAAQCAQLQGFFRTGLRAAFAVPACAFLESCREPV